MMEWNPVQDRILLLAASNVTIYIRLSSKVQNRSQKSKTNRTPNNRQGFQSLPINDKIEEKLVQMDRKAN